MLKTKTTGLRSLWVLVGVLAVTVGVPDDRSFRTRQRKESRSRHRAFAIVQAGSFMTARPTLRNSRPLTPVWPAAAASRSGAKGTVLLQRPTTHRTPTSARPTTPL